MCACACMWRPEAELHPSLLFYLIHWGRVSEPNPELSDTVGFPGQIALGNSLFLHCCVIKLFLGRHNRYRAYYRYRYHQSSTWWTNEFYWGYLQEYGWGVTDWRQLQNHRPPSMDDISQSWEPGTLCTTCSSLTGWRMASAGASVGLNYFQAAWLVSASARYESLLCSLAPFRLRGRLSFYGLL